MMEMRVLVSSILRKFTIRSLQKEDELRPAVELILRPETGIIIELSRREPVN